MILLESSTMIYLKCKIVINHDLKIERESHPNVIPAAIYLGMQ